MSIRLKKKTVLACIAVLLVAALAITLSFFLNAPLTAQADETNLHATYGGTHGQIDGGPKSDADALDNVIKTYGVNAANVYKIDNGEKLFNFLNGNVSTNYTHAYLSNDVSIAYGGGANAAGAYDYYASVNSSNAIFNRVLDGNGHTVRIWSETGQINYVDQTDGYYSYGNITYRVGGLMVAVNNGTISNLTVEYNANHGTVSAVLGWTYSWPNWKNNGMDNNETDCLWTPQSNNSTIFGVIAGQNDAGGLIDNVRVNINNNLKVVDRQSTSNGYLVYNMIYLGGLAGRARPDSKIRNCQVNIANNTGIYGAAEGDDLHSGNDKGSLAIVGGILGKIDQSYSDESGSHNAVLEYCAITGSGMVKALANKAQGNNTYYRAYSGGVIGACLNVTANNGGIQDGGKESGTQHTAEPNQIKSIISDWTGECQNNYQNEATTIYGQLFGSIGRNVQNCVVLYDLLAERAGRGQTTETIDSFRSGVLTSWVGVYPKSEGGQVIVRFNSDVTSIYDIRIHAFADGCDKDDASLLLEAMGNSRNRQYNLASGATGNIIWESYFGDSERINLRISNPVYAEILAVSANVNSVVNYTYSFGSMTTLTLTNTNGSTNSRDYKGMKETLNKPSVSAASGASLSLTDANWEIKRNGAITSSDMSGTALPGTYTMNVKPTVSTYANLGYYDADQRFAAWQPADYKYVITEGVLSYGLNTIVSPDWSKSATFELTMPSEDVSVENFNFVRYVRNGTVVVGSENEFSVTGNSATITIEETTGKNGMRYSFIAYAMDGDSAIPVARTNSSLDYLVKIDREAPEISDMSFYTVDDNGNIKERISTSEFETVETTDATGKVTLNVSQRDSAIWRTDLIAVKYVVNDTKSGIKFADSTSGIENKPLSDDASSYEVTVTLSNSTVRPVSYTDNNGNSVVVALQANVDHMTSDPRLALYNYTYASSEYGYSTSGVIVRFVPTIGSSPWYLQYSYQKDANGNDIWVTAPAQDAYGADIEGEDYVISGNRTQSFTINWNMGTSVPRVEADFKLQMVNDLYGEVPLSRYDSATGEYVVTDGGLVDSFIINYKVARLYVDTSLKSILVYGGSGEYSYDGESLAAILARANADELKAIFGKAYDGTTNYVNKEYRFQINMQYAYQDDARVSFAEESGVGVLYSPAYIKRPQDIFATFDVKLQYANANKGTTKVIASFDLPQDIIDKYDVYFVEHTGIDFSDDYSEIEGFDSCEVVDIDIEPLVKKVYLADYLASSYYYGEMLPNEIYGASVDGLEGTFDIVLTSDLNKLICDANKEYWVYGNVYDELENMVIEVEPVQVAVMPLPVYLDLERDGGIKDIPTSVSAGTQHTFEAYYYDIDGNRLQAKTTYYLLSSNGDPTAAVENFISASGNYKIVISIVDKNYVTADQGPWDSHYVEGTYQFFFNITQGQLKLALETKLVEYKGAGVGIAYDPGIPEVDPNIFSDKQLSYSYYKYTDSTKYEIVNGKVVISNVLDKTTYLGDKVLPSERGIYLVEIELEGNASFLSESYKGYMVITKASTTIAANTLSYAYTGEYHTFSLEEAQATVIATNNATPWNWETGDPSKVTIKYYDTARRNWFPVSEEKGGDGWINEMGLCSYLITYEGDDNYAGCELTVTVAITEAEFQNIWFTGASGVYNGKNFVNEISRNIPSSYAAATIVYVYNNRRYYSLSDITVTNVGEHVIYMTVSMTNYKTTQYSATLSISQAQFTGVEAVPYAGVYDGNQHTVSFTGLTEKNGEYYYTVKDEKGIAVKDDNGNDIQIKVNITGKSGEGLTNGLYAVEAGSYNLSVTLSADNYASLTLTTGAIITIEQVRWPVDATWTNMPSKIPSGVSVSGYYGTYTNSGNEVECTLVYRNADGEVVTPDADGILPDGKYSVTLYVGNNHYIDKAWSLTVGRINSPELSTASYIVLSVAIAVIVAAIVTSVVVVNKRKKADGAV
ncbi:MAG: hypothetical protein K2G37_01075 [Clostridia bacterium]|nr:hypothetical protein [Clostridia bacterium]MDE7328544.1 hypothetical protein [Clostridia bacterium]